MRRTHEIVTVLEADRRRQPVTRRALVNTTLSPTASINFSVPQDIRQPAATSSMMTLHVIPAGYRGVLARTSADYRLLWAARSGGNRRYSATPNIGWFRPIPSFPQTPTW
jgi:hypothetical protein